jgi:hypothetical protein
VQKLFGRNKFAGKVNPFTIFTRKNTRNMIPRGGPHAPSKSATVYTPPPAGINYSILVGIKNTDSVIDNMLPLK